MKPIFLLPVVMFAGSYVSNAQTSPPTSVPTNHRTEQTTQLSLASDTLNFTPFATETIITTQYLDKGVTFEGYNGSAAPITYNYPTLYGSVLHSDTWYNALRINFVDSKNAKKYHLAQKIEFDNPIGKLEGETDYMSINVYNDADVLLYHYLSKSPERVVINFKTPSAAYITVDDSASTAYVLDNLLVDFGNTVTEISANEMSERDSSPYPNPFSDELKISTKLNEHTEVILFDISSKVLLEHAFTNSTTINTEELTKGIYFYELKNKNGAIKKGKIVKY